MIKCTKCGGNMELHNIARQFARNGNTHKVYANAYVCSTCGEVVYPTKEAKRIERILSE